MTTDEQIAILLLKQTYEERVSFAEFLSGLSDHSAEGIASALADWANATLEAEEPLQ